MDEEIVASRSRVSSLVAGWLKTTTDEEPGAAKEEVIDKHLQEARPARVGLGAKFLSHAEAVQASREKREQKMIENKVTGKNKRKQEEEAQGSESEPESDDGMSRTSGGRGAAATAKPKPQSYAETMRKTLEAAAAIQAKKKKKRKKKKKKVEPAAAP